MTDEFWDRHIDTMPWADLQSWQRSRLSELLQGLRQRSPVYAQLYEQTTDARLTDARAWAGVPFMGKDDLRSAQQSGVAMLGDLQCAADIDIVQVVASSGTSGLPVFFGLTEADRMTWMDSIANMWFTAGIRPSSVVALTTGMPLVAGGLPYADAIRRIGAALVWVGGQTPARMATILELLKVDVLIGTASFNTFFAERFEKLLGYPASRLAVRTVIGGGEPGMGQEAIRAQIREGWGAERVSEMMGIGDVMAGLWAECPEGAGMHFTAGRNVLVELIDPVTGDVLPWAEGADGEAVYTTFTRQASPVVRFRSRDHMKVLGTSCACGRTSPRVRCVGRTDDMLIYKAMNVFPSAIRDLALEFVPQVGGPMRVRKSATDQVRFDDPIPVEVELATNLTPGEVPELAQRIEDTVRERLRVRIAVELLPAGSIPIGDYKNGLTYVAG